MRMTSGQNFNFASVSPKKGSNAKKQVRQGVNQILGLNGITKQKGISKKFIETQYMKSSTHKLLSNKISSTQITQDQLVAIQNASQIEKFDKQQINFDENSSGNNTTGEEEILENESAKKL